MKTRCWLSLLVLFAAAALGAQDLQAWLPDNLRTGRGFPENDEVRRQLEELIFAPIGSVPRTLPGAESGRIFAQRSATHRVKVRIERQERGLYALFLNQRPPGQRAPGDVDLEYPVAGAGSYIIKRDLRDGSFVQAKIYLRDDPGCFVRLFPQGERCTLDAYLFGVPVARRVIVPMRFDEALLEPFARVMRLTEATVRWERFFERGEPDADRRSRAVAQEIRGRLEGLGDREDGTLDEVGRYVFIDSGLPQGANPGLNCSGFAKWVTDGFVYPLAGEYLSVDPLKRRHLEARGDRWSRRLEEERDPYFGLDWSRNLALSLLEAAGYPVPGAESADVRASEYVRYIEDVGYAIGELPLVLYLEAARNPGMFYLGSVSREYGSEPVLRQHFHLVVLIPYFTESGAFQVAVFDRGRESSLAGLQERFAGTFVHLVRLPVGDDFAPPVPVR
ncbi:MAG: hypothetical protein JW820_07800 [Spirochaetales bacterium]|nr:hypothetical protein [Spirochaetales bacterium]